MILQGLLSLAATLFCVGIYGVLSRRSAIGALLGVELMANAVNLVLVSFSAVTPGLGAMGHAFTLFAIALTVAEVVVGLGIVVLLYRAHRDVQLDLANEMSG